MWPSIKTVCTAYTSVHFLFILSHKYPKTLSQAYKNRSVCKDTYNISGTSTCGFERKVKVCPGIFIQPQIISVKHNCTMINE